MSEYRHRWCEDVLHCIAAVFLWLPPNQDLCRNGQIGGTTNSSADPSEAEDEPVTCQSRLQPRAFVSAVKLSRFTSTWRVMEEAAEQFPYQLTDKQTKQFQSGRSSVAPRGFYLGCLLPVLFFI